MMQPRSIQALKGVHPDLVKVIERADANGVRFVVVCGRRTVAEQKVLVAQGKSKTMHSRHITGHAVDLVDEHFTWSEHAMRDIADGVKRAAAEVGVPVEWGGDWKSFIDTPHFQLPQAQYPDNDTESHGTKIETAISVSSAPAPLTRSGTIWGSVGAGVAGVSAYLEEAWGTATQTIAAMTEIQPLRESLATVGGNAKALAFSLTLGCLALVICRRVKAASEGKAG